MTNPWGALDWRQLSQEERDRGLNNGAAVANSGEIVAGWDRLSGEMRARHPQHLDLRYGSRERNRIDFLKSAEAGPTLVFIHGGYWQTRAKENFTLFAAGPLAHGINVALIGYTLAPDASIDDIIREISSGLDFLVEKLPVLGGDADRIVVCGWSAGGHHVDGAGASPREGRAGDQRHLRSRADPPQLSQCETWARCQRVRAQFTAAASRRPR